LRIGAVLRAQSTLGRCTWAIVSVKLRELWEEGTACQGQQVLKFWVAQDLGQTTFLAHLFTTKWTPLLAKIEDKAVTQLPPFPPEQFRGQYAQDQVWHKCLLDTEFVAGVPHTRLEAWERYFTWANAGGPNTQQQVLQWLRHGVKVQWVAIHNGEQQKHPRFKQRLALVKQLLENTFPNEPAVVQALLRREASGGGPDGAGGGV
jgi:hypothetical protein